MDSANPSSPASNFPALRQVGALVVRFVNDRTEMLLLTSRETKRWVIPKGWPMKGMHNWAAAAQEAREEAGILGRMHKKPIGGFLYFKRRNAQFDLCRVEVYVLEYEKVLAHYREKGQREARWFSIDEAAEHVEEPGLMELLRGLDAGSLRKTKRKSDKRKSGGARRARAGL
jgi:8-oxo-dGTP pyrophosphatase MutT (NUDIX family)